MQGTARAPGSCGELIQGTLGGANFLVTCPVNMYSTAKVTINDTGIITVNDNIYKKGAEAVRLALRHFGLSRKGARLEINSDIPRGKGMASSTADIVAAAAAVAQAVGGMLSPWQIARLALQIEPSDGIMFDGISLFDHVRGEMLEYMGTAPELDFLIVDLGGQVDTLEFNRREGLARLNRDKEPEIKAALAMLRKGFADNNNDLIAKAATMSAFANQRIIYKEKLLEIYHMALAMGALGINVAHSGTVVGLIYPGGRINPLVEEGLNNILGQDVKYYRTKMVNGGAEILTIDGSEPHWKKYSIYTGETCLRPLGDTASNPLK